MVTMTQNDTSVLSRELATYNAHLDELLIEQGKFVLVAEDSVLGIFDTYRDALAAGYAARGLSPFLVKQIASHEVAANFTRSLEPA